MKKTIVSKNYQIFLRHLKKARRNANFTQVQLSKKIGATQSFISKCERGERRLDVIELRSICKALGISFSKFIKFFDEKAGG